MTIDPRTLREVTNFADCHLIPKIFGASNATVPLDAGFDSCVGRCDAHLHGLYRTLWGHGFEGKAAVGGKKFSAEMSMQAGAIVIPKPRRGTVQDWTENALCLNDGKVKFEGFIGKSIHTGLAALSALNSAFLILYHQKHPHLCGASFDDARALLRKAESDELTDAEMESLKKMFHARIHFDPKRRESTAPQLSWSMASGWIPAASPAWAT